MSDIDRKRRITQVAECCGRLYVRWRLRGRKWGLRRTECVQCLERLDWESSDATNRAASLRYYYRKRQNYLAAGLNTRGQPYRRTPFLTSAQRRQASLTRYHCRAQRRLSAGLTTRGTVRKYGNPVEFAWRQFRSTITIPNASLDLTTAERCEL